MIKLDQAVSEAKNFLQRSGIHFPALEEVSRKDKKWVVVLTSHPRVFVAGSLPDRYTVELDAETGDVVGFRKEQPGT